MTPAESTAALRRILQAVEGSQRKRWVEISCAVLLSLATMASAWCAYQSTLWGGVQTFRLAAAGKAGRKSSELTIAALQYKAFDASMFIEYMKARVGEEKALEKFLFDRFRPEMKTAVDAWLATNPFTDPNAPLGPFRIDGAYQQAEQKQSDAHQEEATRQLEAAQEANQTSDAYVLLTVLFASVLFFGGIGGSMEARRLRLAMLGLSLLLFIATVAFLATMPICRE